MGEFLDYEDKALTGKLFYINPILQAGTMVNSTQSAYPTIPQSCKRQPRPVTSGDPMRIHTPADAVLTHCMRATKVPLHFRDEARAGLEADVKKGVLERVPMGQPDTWCAQIVIQPKSLEEQEGRWINPTNLTCARYYL